MSFRLSTVALVIGALLFTGRAFADCAGHGVADKKRLYEKAQTLEREGRKDQALRSYRAAQGYACEPVNPYEADAAKRAAPLGKELGEAAEKKGNLRLAFEMYEAGGHFAIADRVFRELIEARQDDPNVYQEALEHYRNREGAFFSNNAAALKVTGTYQVDPKYMAEVLAMPPKAVERAQQKEMAAFDQQYLREYVQLIQSRTEDLADASAVQRSISAQQAFNQKWKQQDLVKNAREALQLMRMWGMRGNDENFSKSVEARFATLVEQRATTLRTAFHGAPKLLEDAMDYYRALGGDRAELDGKLAAVRSQAIKLGDEANSKQRLQLAYEYYSVGGNDEKADAARAKQQQLAMQKMQPGIDAARKQAEAMRKELSDPAKVEAMRQQAEAAQKVLQQQRETAKQNNEKSADELEKELGL